ncbi:hypothetical protein CTZ27_07310 [Streptomyces griseocarneus]|nr:hypothetical protein CTZ27_07310 [Streptomyces griseocarneus]
MSETSHGTTAGTRSRLREIPTVTARDGIGGTLAFKRDPLSFLAGGIARHGDIFRFRPLGIPMVLVNHPDHVQHVLADNSANYDKDAFIFKAVRPMLRDGLIPVTDMDRWRRQRHMMAPHFTPRAVASFVHNMTDETEQALGRWEERARADADGILEFTEEFGQLALRIVNRSLFSAAVGDAALAFERAFGAANGILGDFLRFPFPPLSVPTPSHRRLRRAIDDMDAFVSLFVDKRLSGNEEDGADGGADLLSLLLHSVDEESGTGMGLEQLHHEVLNLCVGAFETTTCGLSWTFDLLARHPEAEEKLHAEVDAVLGGRLPVFEDLERLVHTRRIIDEALRIRSPAFQTMRRAREEDELAGFRVPAGSNMVINSYLLHRHPDFWDDPERFDPDRFTPEEVARRPRHAYVPFGSGPRVCIGKHFALTELALVLASVARGHRLVLPEGAPAVEPEARITLRPKGGVRLRLERRR